MGPSRPELVLYFDLSSRLLARQNIETSDPKSGTRTKDLGQRMVFWVD